LVDVTVTIIEFDDTESVVAGPNPKQLLFAWNLLGAGSVDHLVLEINPDGVSGFSQVDLDGDGVLDVADQLGPFAKGLILDLVALHFTDFLGASYQIVALDGTDGELARSSELFIDGLDVNLIGFFKASNTDPGDQFGGDRGGGVSLSADGNTMAIGAPFEDSLAQGINPADDGNNSNTPLTYNSGAVYVFTRAAGGVWSQEAYLKASNTGGGDLFGVSVSLSGDGNRLAVGANGEDSGAEAVKTCPCDGTGAEGDESALDAGAVYIFERGGNGWSQQAYVKSLNPGADDRFGQSVSLSLDGDALVVGAPREDSAIPIGTSEINPPPNEASDNSGAAYVFRINPLSALWQQEVFLKAFNFDVGDRFGFSVGISQKGETVLVGAIDEDSNQLSGSGVADPFSNGSANSGAAYVFQFNQGFWSQEQFLKAANQSPDDRFGYSLSLSASGDVVAIGAPFEDSGDTGVKNCGFEFLCGNAGQNGSAFLSGAAYVFRRPAGGSWIQEAFVKASNPDPGDEFGHVCLSPDGNTLAVGARLEDSQVSGIKYCGGFCDGTGAESDNAGKAAGAVYVYTRDATDWSAAAYVKAPNSDAGDHFGRSMSFTLDGETMAVGAPNENSLATGVDGKPNEAANNSGAVYLY
jgi:hypothetical protein